MLVTSSTPSTKAKQRIAENSLLIALINASVNRANSATDPLTSQSTTNSGRVVRGRRHAGSSGRPPVESDFRMV